MVWFRIPGTTAGIRAPRPSSDAGGAMAAGTLTGAVGGPLAGAEAPNRRTVLNAPARAPAAVLFATADHRALLEVTGHELGVVGLFALDRLGLGARHTVSHERLEVDLRLGGLGLRQGKVERGGSGVERSGHK
jgi:hypothetical protein